MARVGKFLHSNSVIDDKTLGTSFSTSVVHSHTLSSAAFSPQSRYIGVINGLEIRLTSAGSPTTVTVRICKDAAGDIAVVPDTQATLVAGISTNTIKCARFKIDLPIEQDQGSAGNTTLFVFAKVDDATGSPKLASSTITWQE